MESQGCRPFSDLPSPVLHGGNILATAKQLCCRPADLIDLSSNLTPLGQVPGLRETLLAHLDEIAFLPETGSETLRARFGAKFGRQPTEIMVGNGTTEFIFAVPAAFKGGRALIVAPTYADYRLASHWAGLESSTFNLRAEEEFRLEPTELARRLRGNELVFLCNPNNPTGKLIDSVILHGLIGAHPRTTFVVDETYLPFTRQASLLEQPPLDNLLVLSSFSKIYGIPGLRLGFLTGSATTLASLAARNRPWGVNRLAQVAGEFLLAEAEEYRRQVLDFLDQHRPPLAAALAELPGVRVFPSQANFILARLEGEITALALQQSLLEHYRIMVRNCADFEGLDERYFRVCLKDPAANQALLQALTTILTTSGTA